MDLYRRSNFLVMPIRFFIFVIAMAAFYCYAQTVLLPRDCWLALQKVSNFRELYSETNIPPEIISDCAAQFPHRRLLWAVTDGKYYVMHHEYVDFGTNYSIYIDTTNHASISCGYSNLQEIFRHQSRLSCLGLPASIAAFTPCN